MDRLHNILAQITDSLIIDIIYGLMHSVAVAWLLLKLDN